MEELRAFHLLQLSQDTHQFDNVMSVEGSEVSDIQSFKDILLMTDSRFQGIAQTDDSFAAVILEIAFGMEPSRQSESQGIISLIGVEFEQILLHASHTAVDTHIVIIEYDKHVIRC